MTSRQRTLVMIAARSALLQQKKIPPELRRARRLRIPRKALEELFIHLSLILGFPSMLDGLEQLQRIWPGQGKTRATRSSTVQGMKILTSIYGDQTVKLLRNLKGLHAEAADWIVHDVYGKIFCRQGLTLRERELVTVAVLSLQGHQRQLYSHMRGALRLGVSEETLRHTVGLLDRASRRRHRSARIVLDRVVSQRKMS